MKILHTSDWHLGQEFYTYNRIEEHLAFFHQLTEIVAKEQPDVMVVSGDIYHNATPSNTVMRLFTDRLDAVRSACPSMEIVLTAGNHDSSARLEVNRSIWQHLGVSIVGRIEKREGVVDLDRHIIGVHSKVGALCGYVVALPHVFPNAFPLMSEDTPREVRQTAFFTALDERLREVNTQQLPVVMMAHMALTGSDITGHDETRGGMDYTDVSDLKVDYDYLALGHIHCPQFIGDEHARYCGSPIPVSFDEQYGHSVTVVELVKHGDEPQVRWIPIENPWPLLTLPKESLPFEEAIQTLKDFPSDRRAYLRLRVKLADVPPANALEHAFQAVSDKEARFCCFLWERNQVTEKVSRTFDDLDEIKAQSPLDIAKLYYQNQYGQPMDENLQKMLQEVITETDKSEEES